MSKKTQQFHMRMDPKLKKRLLEASKKLEVSSGRNLSLAETVVAFCELGLGKVESELPVVDVPSLKKKGAVQRLADGRHYLAPLWSSETYEEIQTRPRPLDMLEPALFDTDAKHVRKGSEAVVRGNVFSQCRHVEALKGEKVTVLKISGVLASVSAENLKGTVRLHVYDLEPVPGLCSSECLR